MLAAHGQWQRIQKERASIAELPVAQLTAMLGNIHRDPKKGEPFNAMQFCLFREQDSEEQVLPPVVAAVALELRHEQRCPPLLLTIWPQILASVQQDVKVPEVRALKSDDEAVWVLAPTWEGKHCRGALVLVKGQISGTMLLRELDRPLMTHHLQIPSRHGFGWLEAGLLLLSET